MNPRRNDEERGYTHQNNNNFHKYRNRNDRNRGNDRSRWNRPRDTDFQPTFNNEFNQRQRQHGPGHPRNYSANYNQNHNNIELNNSFNQDRFNQERFNQERFNPRFQNREYNGFVAHQQEFNQPIYQDRRPNQVYQSQFRPSEPSTNFHHQRGNPNYYPPAPEPERLISPPPLSPPIERSKPKQYKTNPIGYELFSSRSSLSRRASVDSNENKSNRKKGDSKVNQKTTSPPPFPNQPPQKKKLKIITPKQVKQVRMNRPSMLPSSPKQFRRQKSAIDEIMESDDESKVSSESESASEDNENKPIVTKILGWGKGLLAKTESEEDMNVEPEEDVKEEDEKKEQTSDCSKELNEEKLVEEVEKQVKSIKENDISFSSDLKSTEKQKKVVEQDEENSKTTPTKIKAKKPKVITPEKEMERISSVDTEDSKEDQKLKKVKIKKCPQKTVTVVSEEQVNLQKYKSRQEKVLNELKVGNSKAFVSFLSSMRNSVYNSMKGIKSLQPKSLKKTTTKRQPNMNGSKSTELSPSMKILTSKWFAKAIQNTSEAKTKMVQEKIRMKLKRLQQERKLNKSKKPRLHSDEESEERIRTRQSNKRCPTEHVNIKSTRSTSMSNTDRRDLGNVINSSSMLNSDVFAQDMVFDKFACAERRFVNAAIIPAYDPIEVENMKKFGIPKSMQFVTVDNLPPKCESFGLQATCFKSVERSMSAPLSKLSPMLASIGGKYCKQLHCNCAKSVAKIERMHNKFSDIEKLLFLEKFLQFPKNFKKISVSFRNKNCKDIIDFYYRTKKLVNFKEILREQFHRRKLTRQPCWELVVRAGEQLGISFQGTKLLEMVQKREIILSKLSTHTKLKDHRTVYSPQILYPLEEEIVNYALGQYETEEERHAAVLRLLPDVLVNFNDFVSDNKFSEFPAPVFHQEPLNNSIKMPTQIANIAKNSNPPPLQRQTSNLSQGGKNKWLEEEKVIFLDNLKIFGKNWKKVSTFLPNKTIHQVRNYYQNYKVRLELDSYLPQTTWANGGSRKSSSHAGNEKSEQKRRGSNKRRAVNAHSEVATSEANKHVQQMSLKQAADPSVYPNLQNGQINLNNPSVAAALASLPPSTLQNLINSGMLNNMLNNSMSNQVQLQQNNQMSQQQMQQQQHQQQQQKQQQQQQLQQQQQPQQSGNFNNLSMYGNNLELELVQSVRAVFDEIRKKVDVAQVAYASQLNSLADAYLGAPDQKLEYHRFQLGMMELTQMIYDTKRQLVSEYETAKSQMVETLVKSNAKGVVLQVFDTEDQVAVARFEQLLTTANCLNVQTLQRVQKHQEENEKNK